MKSISLAIICSSPLFLVLTTIPSGGALPKADPPTPPQAKIAQFKIRHTISVQKIPTGSKKVRVWFWYPAEDGCQKILDFSLLSAAKGVKVTHDLENGHFYLYLEVDNPNTPEIQLATEFLIQRQSTAVKLDPALAGPLTTSHKLVFAEYLRKDCPDMEVSSTISDLAKEVCGKETNVVKQVRKLFNWVVENTNHHGKGGTAPKSSGIGSAQYCLNNKGGGCTDQHALFMALCRARGIPTRIFFGSLLQPANEGKDVDPGYRCWVQYFVPNYGWVSADLSAANLDPAKKDFYFCNLDERRVCFSAGRDIQLNPQQSGPRLNLFIGAHVEVDGQPHTAFQRKLLYSEVKSQQN